MVRFLALLHLAIMCAEVILVLAPGSFFTSARLIYVAGKEGYLPAMFGRHNKTLKTPLNAMILQAVVTIMFIVVGGGFRSLINFAVVGKESGPLVAFFSTILTVVLISVLGFLLPNGNRYKLSSPSREAHTTSRF